MLAAVIIFLYTFLSYAAWVFTFSFRLPPKYRRDGMKAALGMSNGLRIRITESFNKLKGNAFPKNEAPKRPMNGFKSNGNRLDDN